MNIGIEQTQVTLTFWKELNDEELDLFFQDICHSFPEIKFLLYNNPRIKRGLKGWELKIFTKISLSGDRKNWIRQLEGHL